MFTLWSCLWIITTLQDATRYPLPAKAQPFVLLRAAGSVTENVEIISGQFLSGITKLRYFSVPATQ